ncbi:fatty acid synthase-like [Toxorhynchites rutilus septentrionalis]|uniref:fatty acid synthase-like n=1 Tax=Toxorhynchites rutilus septentrionalis TaxID=329112 RepID=UPI002479D5F6|nr:fatty acid synthase-like [Toxorhynchites rutilus septentrionalis]
MVCDGSSDFGSVDLDECVVIAGMSGRFPRTDNMREYADYLFNKHDCVDDEESRWPHTMPEVPRRSGKINNLDRFDREFFGLSRNLSNAMDPQLRMLMEHTYEAILDAGVNPETLRGSRTGVFSAICFSETEATMLMRVCPVKGYGMLGCARSQLSNRISHTFDFTGPSMVVDTACSSSMYAFNLARRCILSGECDAAIVAGVNLCLQPYITYQFALLGVLAKDGYAKPFDANACGYTRSEAVCAVFLQKARDANRIYTHILTSKTNCDGFKPEGIAYPSGKLQGKMLKEAYGEISVDPSTISFMEAHSTGTIVGDPEECDAIDKIFCTNRDRPLPIGSVKSNMGHGEAAAGLASIVKCVFALESGIIPPNINFTTVRTDVPALVAGRLQVVSDPQPLEGTLVGVNSFGFGGANGHTLLRRHMKQKVECGVPQDDIPRLVIWSGRTQRSVEVMFEDIAQRALDGEFISLMYNVQRHRTPAHRYRGFAIFSKQGTEKPIVELSKIERIALDIAPLVVVFPGINLRWKEDLDSLYQFPQVRLTVAKCCSVLNNIGYNFYQVEDAQTDILKLIIGSTVLQLAYVDLLNAIGVTISAFGGHSIGQFTCAYLDQCLTLDETVKLAYAHGKIFAEYNVKLSHNAFLELGAKRPAPPLSFDGFAHEKTLASRYGIVGGPLSSTRTVVDQLKSRGSIAEHLPFVSLRCDKEFVEELAEQLEHIVRNIVPNQARTSSRWYSAKSSSLFTSAAVHESTSIVHLLERIPSNCRLLVALTEQQSMELVVKRLNRTIRCLTGDQQPENSVMNVLSTLGQLYLSQHDLNLLNLYPPVEFPVSQGTSMISPLIKWDHRESCMVARFEFCSARSSTVQKYKISLSDKEFQYITGHCIDGRILYPATGYLWLVWDLMANSGRLNLVSCPIEFSEVQFIQAASLTRAQPISLTVMLQKVSGRFEIMDGTTPLVVGYARQLEDSFTGFPPCEKRESQTTLLTKDFYKELRLRGYHYNGLFKSVLEAANDGSSAKIEWKGNWVPFLDSVLQIGIIAVDSRSLMVPTAIESLTIYPQQHLSLMSRDAEERDFFEVKNCAITNSSTCGAVRITGVRVNIIGRRNPPGVPVLETYQFIPYHPTTEMSMLETVRMCVQIALENNPTNKLNCVEIYEEDTTVLLPFFGEAAADLPLINPTLTLLSAKELDIPNVTIKDEKLYEQSNLQFLVCNNNLSDAAFLRDALTSLTLTGHLVIRSDRDQPFHVPSKLNQIASFPVENNQTLWLLQVEPVREPPAVIRVRSDDTNFDWLQELKATIKTKSVLLYTQDDPTSGIIGLVNCIIREPKTNGVQCFFVDDPNAPAFSLDDPFYKQQIGLNMAINVYRDGTWGSYRHLLLQNKPKVEAISNHCYANCLTKGDLSTLTWVNGSMNVAPPKGELIRVVYSALNFRDVMVATGRISSDVLYVDRLEEECLLGNEYSGVSVNGRRVMGVLSSGSMATLVECDPQLTWTIPDSWSLEDAATVPVVYGTVYMAFFVCAHIKKGKSILIHAGSGGVGLAAIQVCLTYGLEVFTTVSTAEKRDFIMERYPQLKRENIGNSRDISFEHMIKLRTGGRGVDYVLNSLAEEKLQASIRCLGRNGHFLEIGKYDMAKNSQIAMQLFQKGLTFTAVMLDAMFKGEFSEKQRLHALLTTDINKGFIRPLNTTVYPAVEIEKAFRFLASGKHMGKILLRIREQEGDMQTVPIAHLPRVYCNPNHTYIIIGGLGGFGLELADWLVLRGCRKLVLSSSRGITKPYQEFRIKLWNSYGVRTVVTTADITTPDGCKQLIQQAAELGLVVAIFNLAVQLRDCILENQTVQTFTECFAPKANATTYLDDVSRQLCPNLRYFVVFSSVSCGRGNAGQSNYGMANSVMERIIEKRVADGLPGKAIQWGAVGEVGIVADLAEDKVDMEIGGTLQQRISSCLQVLDNLLLNDNPIVASMVVAEKRAGSGSRNIIEAVMNIMCIRDLKSISMDSTLADIGMDSLMAVEIKQVLERDFDMSLSPQELRTLTFLKLQKLADEKKIRDEAKDGHEPEKVVIGFEMLLRNLGDEKFCDEVVLRLPSLAEDGRPILIIPGLEGVAGKVWHTIASGINAPVFILQTLVAADHHSIPEMVDLIMEELCDKVFQDFNDYSIVAYSFGSYIALELARRLQSRNISGKLLLIDGSPALLYQLSLEYLGENPPDALIEKFLMAGIISLVLPNQPPEKVYSIMEVPTYEAQIEKLIEVGKDKADYTPDYTRRISRALFNRCKLVCRPDAANGAKLNLPIVLARASEASTSNIGEDYGLSGHTTGLVSIRTVSGTHMTMLENPELIEIINSVNV